MIQLKDIVGTVVTHIYEWRDFEVSETDIGGVFIRIQTTLEQHANTDCIIGIPHFYEELSSSFRVDRQLDKRAISLFSKRKKIFRIETPLAKKLKGQCIKQIYFDDKKGYYELENGYVISENLVLPNGINAAGLILFDSIEQLMSLDNGNVMQRLSI